MTVEQSQIPALFRSHSELFAIHPNGKVVVAGHRVPVFLVMEAISELSESRNQLEELESRFPTIDESLLREIVEFLELHDDELQNFYESEKAIRQQMLDDIAENRTGPSLDELRERRRKRLESGE